MEQSVSKEDIAQEFYLDFAEQVLARLGVWVEANPDEIPYNQAFVPDFGDRGHGLVASLEVPDYRSLLDRWWGEEAEWFWTEAEKGVELEIIGGNLSIPETIRDGEDGPMRIATAEEIEAIKEQIKPFLINNIYTQPILSLLYRENKLNFTREELDTEYLIFRGNWRGTDHEWTVTIPLLNLESTYYSADEISIPVSRSLAMVRMIPMLKRKLWGASSERFVRDELNLAELHSAKFALVGTFNFNNALFPETPLEDAPELGNLIAEARRFITALRLGSVGEVGMSVILAENKFYPAHIGALPIPVPASHKVRPRYKNHYHLEEAEMLVVRRVLTQLDQDAEKHLSVGLRRFDQSYDRDNAEDALIDLVVALESSLLADNSEQDQLQYKMSLRGAALLASSAPPQKTQRQIRALYTARSKIVHSGKHLTDKKIKKLFADLEPPVDVHEIVDFSQKITRALLLEYVSRLNESNSLATVNKELDEKIVNSLALSSASYEADHPSN